MSCANIYAILKKSGINDVGACALLGNFEAESNCESVRVQGDTDKSRTKSKQYVADIDSGVISKSAFANDQKGFGLYQLTYYKRKENFYDYVKSKNVSIGNETTQVEFAIKELSEEYSSLFSALKTSTDLYAMVERVCKEFERPAINNVNDRYNYAINIKNTLKLSFTTSNQTQGEQPNYKNGSYPLLTSRLATTKLHCVESCQTLLALAGYKISASGYYDTTTQQLIKQFQTDKGLVADGQCGASTWQKLIEG